MKVFRLLLAVITTASFSSSKGKPLANALVSLHHILKDNMDGFDNEKISITSNSWRYNKFYKMGQAFWLNCLVYSYLFVRP